ncbi:hypothetical protein PAMC26510_08700 [Caballeronia sordidicola]|uniref:Uncharacterized protein n=1 Tax=Caballeronia sordidicola TaxID=196367 RepID=A0A242N237_CABSO|nr:hypothetical protein PAMC26510_08700 [Caballeronia sordidicola]
MRIVNNITPPSLTMLNAVLHSGNQLWGVLQNFKRRNKIG